MKYIRIGWTEKKSAKYKKGICYKICQRKELYVIREEVMKEITKGLHNEEVHPETRRTRNFKSTYDLIVVKQVIRNFSLQTSEIEIGKEFYFQFN